MNHTYCNCMSVHVLSVICYIYRRTEGTIVLRDNMAACDTQVGIALFGIGRAGTIHAKSLVKNPRVNLRWIVDEDEGRAKSFVRDWNLSDTRVTSSEGVDHVWNDAMTLGIVISLPPVLHEEIIIQGLKAGKSVFCEKPLAPYPSQVINCYAKANETGKPLMCAFNRRFDPSIRKLRNRIIEGDIGQVQSIKITSRDPLPPPGYFNVKSGGIFRECAVHDIDIICWIMGTTPKTVFAQGHVFNNFVKSMGDIDQANIQLQFPNGAIACVDLNRNCIYGYDQRIEVLGSKGMLQTHNQTDTPISMHNERGECRSPIYPSYPERYSDSYVYEMNHFVDLVEGNTDQTAITMDDTLNASLVADLCAKSMEEGKCIAFQNT